MVAWGKHCHGGVDTVTLGQLKKSARPKGALFISACSRLQDDGGPEGNLAEMVAVPTLVELAKDLLWNSKLRRMMHMPASPCARGFAVVVGSLTCSSIANMMQWRVAFTKPTLCMVSMALLKPTRACRRT